MIIPLEGGSANAHQTFSLQLGENFLDFELNYLQTGQWSMNILQAGVIIAAGAMLEPNCDIISAYDIDIGQLIFLGDNTTLDNLGQSNYLNWVAPE